MIGAILSFFGKGALNRILDTIDKRVDGETERQQIIGDAVKHYVETDAQLRATAMQSRIFWWVWAAFAAPVAFWFGAICLDSVFLLSGHIADLPASVKPYATQIFSAIFGSGAAVAGLQAVASAIKGRR
ncbi:MAG: hypothetical protein DI604_23525 [Delftia acidovorans]|nr:MAG: hypothetical protein DI604_23525 [Delftia acidovorans]